MPGKLARRCITKLNLLIPLNWSLSGERRTKAGSACGDRGLSKLGTDNDKEVDTLDPKTPSARDTYVPTEGLHFSSVRCSLEEEKTPKKLSVMIRMVQPKDDQRSFVATL